MKGGWMGPTLLVLALVLLVLVGLGGVSTDAEGSVGSSARGGRLAGFLVLEELGHAPEVWLQPPGELPAGPHQVWLAVAPPFPEERDEALAEDDPLEAARSAGPAGVGRYLEFMEQGGTLVLPATERTVLFLEQALDLESEPLLAWERERPGGLIGGGLELTSFETPAGTQVIEHHAGEELLATEVGVGAGSCVLIASGDYLDNDHLAEGDNGLLLVHLAERRADGARLLFDEHALGLVSGPSSTGLALSPRGLLLTLNLGLLLLILCWREAWAREFPRDPAPLGRVSPLARARGLADLLQRAGRIDVLAEMLRVGDGRRTTVPQKPSTAPTTSAGLVSLDARLRTHEHPVHGDGNP